MESTKQKGNKTNPQKSHWMNTSVFACLWAKGYYAVGSVYYHHHYHQPVH